MSSGPPPMLSQDVADFVESLPMVEAGKVLDQLRLLPVLDETAGQPVPGLDGYRTLTLPSGYLVAYRWLSDEEKEGVARPADEAVSLVAAIQPLAISTSTGATGPVRGLLSAAAAAVR